ncbi:hypothetical protein HDE_10483 [Halotydeus destructor]|nr:hypothetical protein HDE_10483 [Halotydeus destructor]
MAELRVFLITFLIIINNNCQVNCRKVKRLQVENKDLVDYMKLNPLLNASRSECSESRKVLFKSIVTEDEDEAHVQFGQFISTVSGYWKELPVVDSVENEQQTLRYALAKNRQRSLKSWLSIMDRKVKFDSGHYLVLTDRVAGEYKLGGFNHAWLGCPNSLCLDPRLDATSVYSRLNSVSNETELQLFRGLFRHTVKIDANGKPKMTPLSQSAQPAISLLHSQRNELDAIYTDHQDSRWVFRHDSISGYIRVDRIDNVASDIAPGITSMFGYGMLKETLLSSLKENGGYIDFGPMETTIFEQFNVTNMNELCFIEEGRKRVYGFTGDEYFMFDHINMERMAAKVVLEAYKPKNPLESGVKATILSLIPSTDTEDAWSGLKAVTELNKEWPTNISAISCTKNIMAIFKDWHVYLVKIDDVVSGRIKTLSMDSMKISLFDYFDCPAELYKGRGFSSKDEFVKKYEPLVKGTIEEEAPSTGKPEPSTFPDQRSSVTRTGQAAQGSANSNHLLPVVVGFFFILILGTLATLFIVYKQLARTKGSKSNKGSKTRTESNAKRSDSIDSATVA